MRAVATSLRRFGEETPALTRARARRGSSPAAGFFLGVRVSERYSCPSPDEKEGTHAPERVSAQVLAWEVEGETSRSVTGPRQPSSVTVPSQPPAQGISACGSDCAGPSFSSEEGATPSPPKKEGRMLEQQNRRMSARLHSGQTKKAGASLLRPFVVLSSGAIVGGTAASGPWARDRRSCAGR